MIGTGKDGSFSFVDLPTEMATAVKPVFGAAQRRPVTSEAILAPFPGYFGAIGTSPIPLAQLGCRPLCVPTI